VEIAEAAGVGEEGVSVDDDQEESGSEPADEYASKVCGGGAVLRLKQPPLHGVHELEPQPVHLTRHDKH
jgi:hypothetical protein